jgi:DNA polymerase I-like protein with 3'-5' exonuclease and polymerase domains
LNSQFANDFLQFTDAERDERIIRRAMGLDGRVYPTFDVVGTVSSRIMVSDPNLQHLRRSYRGIVAADIGKRPIYLDYSQFEPGILAYLSGDAKMVAAYNEGDLYTALSQRVFGTSEQRALSKQMFLAFCYGMTSERISGLVAKAGDAGSALDCSQAVSGFFSSFPGLDEYRSRLAGELERQGHVSSLFGNCRWRTRKGPLAHEEKRWAVNQPIQATASLIFKEAMIRLAETFGNSSILLPMHDAVLLQFDDDETFGHRLVEAEALMLDAFHRRCPGVSAKVTAGPFAD